MRKIYKVSQWLIIYKQMKTGTKTKPRMKYISETNWVVPIFSSKIKPFKYEIPIWYHVVFSYLVMLSLMLYEFLQKFNKQELT